MKFIRLISLLLIICLGLGQFQIVHVQAKPQIDNEYEGGKYLVRFKLGVDLNKKEEKWRSKDISNSNKKAKLKKFKTSNTLSVSLTKGEYEELIADPDVEKIENDSMVELSEEVQLTTEGTVPTTTNQATSWGNHAIGADIAQSNGFTGSGVKIAIVDSGVSPHDDLLVTGGWNVLENNNDFSDGNGHGTYVAGIINSQNNNIGTVGVAPGAEIYAVKAIDASGQGYYSDIIAGIEWAIDNGMDIISISLGGTEYNQALHDAVISATNNDILVVAAAGNKGFGEETEIYPALFSEAISVGAVDSSFYRSKFSSTGAGLDFVTPGQNIYTTTNNNGYSLKSGTSMAVPYATGAIALLISSNLQLQGELQVRELLSSSATQLGGKNEYGNGLINIARALGFIDSSIAPIPLKDEKEIPPDTGYSEGSEVSVTAVIDKKIQYITTGQSATVGITFSDAKPTVTVGVFDPDGIKLTTAGTTWYNIKSGETKYFTWNSGVTDKLGLYTIKFYYNNTIEPDKAFVSVSSIPSKPGIPTNLSVEEVKAESAKLSWNPVSGATGYNIKIGTSYIGSVSSTSYNFENLTPNTSYILQVAATNSSGSSDYATKEIRTLNFNLNMPTGLSVVYDDYDATKVKLIWNNVNNATEYKIMMNGNSSFATVTAASGTTTSYTVTQLELDKDYSFSVAAKNGAAVSSFSSQVQAYTNEVFETALTLNVNISRSADILHSMDQDFYKFIPTTSGKYTFQSSGTTDLFAELYDSEQMLLETSSDIGDDYGNIGISYNLVQGQTYYLVIYSDLSNTIGPYSVKVISSIDDYETVASMSSSSVSGRIDYTGDRDTFKFIPQTSGYYSIISNSAFDTVGILYDSQMKEIDRHDDISSSNRNFKVIHYLNKGEVYFIEMAPYSINSIGDYTITNTLLSDTLAPSAPTWISYVSVGTDVYLHWSSASDANGIDYYEVYRDNVFVTKTTSLYYRDSGLENSKSYSFFIIAYDKAGNKTSGPTISVTTEEPIDNTPPTAPIINISDANWTNQNVTVAITSGNDGSGIRKTEYKIGDDGLWNQYSSQFIISQGGSTTIYARSIDNYGNISPVVSGIVKIDKTAPNAPINFVMNAKTDTTVSLSWTAATDNIGAIKYEIYQGTTLLNTVMNTSYMVTGLKPNTAYSFTVKSKDAAGNISVSSTPVNVTTDAISDTQIPSTPTGLTVSAKTDDSVTLKWTASTDNVGVAGYEVYQGTTLISTVTTTNHTVNGLTPSTEYSFTVKAKDAAGNVSFASSSVKVTTNADSQAPSMPVNVTASVRTATTVTLSWVASTDNIGVVGYEIFSGGLLLKTVTTPSNNVVTGLKPNTTYTFTVKAQDAAGNRSNASAPFDVTTDVDTSEPSEPTEAKITAKSVTSATISWTASVDDVGVVSYEVFNGSNSLGSVSATTYKITNLVPNTTYTIFIKAKDEAGNTSRALSIDVKTDPDITAPTAPIGLVVSEKTNTYFNLSWTASTDDVAVTVYDVYQGTSLIGSTTQTTYRIDNIVPNVSYAFTVKAKDAAGNISNPSNSVQSIFIATSNKVVLSATGNTTMYVKSDGSLWMWGVNGGGQSADGTTTTKTTAVQVPGLSTYTSVGVGTNHVVALKSDGTVWTWGSNNNGQLATGNTTNRMAPGQVTSLTGIIAVAANGDTSYALKNDGTLWAWGYNGGGQLGNNSTSVSYVPVQVSVSGVTAVAVGNGFGLALKSDGTVWAWGSSGYTVFGNANQTNSYIPVQVAGLSGISQIAAGANHGLALKSDGNVWIWGNSGTAANSTVTQVSGINGVVALAAGTSTSFAVKSDGSLWAWGLNNVGQLGDGSTTNRTAPVQLTGISGVVGVTGGQYHGAALKSDGSVWAWGYNASGQLGDATVTQRLTPVAVQNNVAPQVTVTSPTGTQATPTSVSITTPTFAWSILDGASTTFTAYQVQVLNEAGTVILDSGSVTQSTTATTGTWTASSALPTGQKLQIRVRVTDGTSWSEWSVSKWLYIQ
jgi:alpha-tubulin suppressor-like RCC1 family protein